MPGSSSRVSRTGATRFRVTSGSARSSGMAARSPAQPAPALLTSRSTRPWRSRTRPASRSAPPGSARSTASGSPPVRSAISASATASRPASASVAPRSASSGASASPNPLDSGLTVTVGNVDDDYRATAQADGFEVSGVGEAVATADVVYVLIPDEVIPEVFRDEVAPRLRSGACVCFASGYVVAYALVEPPDGVDVLLLAPRMLGEEVRKTYLDGSGFLSYVSVERDATGKAKARLLGLAGAAGSLRRGALELTAA